jgi:hypothetical protein
MADLEAAPDFLARPAFPFRLSLRALGRRVLHFSESVVASIKPHEKNGRGVMRYLHRVPKGAIVVGGALVISGYRYDYYLLR